MGPSSQDQHPVAEGVPQDRVGRRLPLERTSIVAAALAFLDHHPVEELTMRQLGALMGVEAMSLYHHVASREALLDAVVDLVVEEMAAGAATDGEPVAGWRDLLMRQAHGVRRVALEHPHAFVLVASRPPEALGLRVPVRTVSWAETLLAGLQDSGLSTAGSVEAYRAFTSLLVGHLLLEVADHVEGLTPDAALLTAHPVLRPLTSPVSADDGGDELDEALERLFEAIAAHESGPAPAVPGARGPT